ncbi:MAG: DAK2 domain-containing protein [Tepidiformaceae bacterium]
MTVATTLSGAELRRAFAGAAAHLRASAAAIDAINVYPVPDGDTGSNMAATLREAVDAALLLDPTAGVPEVLAAIAKGALYGGRGNSGVILSQALRGLARGAGKGAALDAAGLAAGLREGATAAYAAVAVPTEGTMLTVLRAAGKEAAAAVAGLPAGGAGLACLPIFQRALSAAEAAEAATIEQLPALAEAGVTDAGGEGICAILRGLVAALSGAAPATSAIPLRPIASMAGHEAGFGFCTEFLLEAAPSPLDLAAVRAFAGAGGNTSVVVVGDEAAARVHLHTADPEAVLAAAAELGRVLRVKVDDMTRQHHRWQESGSGATARVALLALSRGPGFDAIFRSLGAAVTDLGEVVKPPAGDIAAAADALGAPDVIVLPNHRNVVRAAEQAAALSGSTLHVVPSRSLVEGIAAALAFDAGQTAAANTKAMAAAGAAVVTVEVTRAAAARSADGIAVRKGEAIALVDGSLVAAAPLLEEALTAGLAAAGAADAALITVYSGEGVAAAPALAAARAAFPDAEVQHVDGGQTLYAYIASVEH